MKRIIWCCKCARAVEPRLTSGTEIYPSRPDLRDVPFWRCDTCKSYVGCHHKTKNPTEPLGSIPSPAIREERKKVHAALDPIWQSGALGRSDVYRRLSHVLGREYHTAELNTLDETRCVLAAIAVIKAGASIDA